MLRPITRIGCICFEDEVADPLSKIRIALTRCDEDYSDALIVLPEALDLEKYYCDKAGPVFGISDLQDLAHEFGVAFVAGLSEQKPEEMPGMARAWNSAFLIDPEGTERLSRKMSCDSPWFEGFRDPGCIPYRGLTVASLICLDATGFSPRGVSSRPLCEDVLERLRGAPKSHLVLCVPARLTYPPKGVAEDWQNQQPDINVVIANMTNRSDCRDGIPPENKHGGIRPAHGHGPWIPCEKGLCLHRIEGNDRLA